MMTLEQVQALAAQLDSFHAELIDSRSIWHNLEGARRNASLVHATASLVHTMCETQAILLAQIALPFEPDADSDTPTKIRAWLGRD
jgi:hypothetical protein